MGFGLNLSHAKQFIRPFTTVQPLCRKDWLSGPKEALLSSSSAAQNANGPTAPPALADPGLVLVRGPDRPDLYDERKGWIMSGKLADAQLV
jgi:hypothetical protein